jgi:probable phosphoglycerate mutase
LNEVALKHLGETIVVITHGGVLSGLFRHTFSIPFEAPRRFEFTNAGLNVFIYEEGNWFLQTWGDLSHLANGGLTPAMTQNCFKGKERSVGVVEYWV